MKHLNSKRLVVLASTAAVASMTLGGAPAISHVHHHTVTSTPSMEQPAAASSPALRHDVNGDGRADIVGFGETGVRVSLGTANWQFTQPGPLLNKFGAANSAGGWRVDTHPRLLGDVNGDGRADIVGFANNGVQVATGNTNGTFTDRGLALGQFGYNAGDWRVDQHPRLLGDVNGDNRADIVGFGNAGVYVGQAKTNGKFDYGGRVLNKFGANDTAGGWQVDRHPRLLAGDWE
jgi:hypothetical protein